MTAEQPVPENTLLFPDKKEDGRYPVTDPQEPPVAYIDTNRSGSSFTATTADGADLCVSKRRGVLSRHWDIVDGTSAPLASQRSRWSLGTAVEMPDGRELSIKGNWTNRGWTMTDEQGNVLLAAEGERGLKAS